MSGRIEDLRYALRQLRKSSGFSAVAVSTRAPGIGVNTAIFSVVNGALLRPLGFKDASRLVRVYHVPPPKSFPGITRFSASAANYLDWETQNHGFDGMAIYTYRSFDLTGGDKPEQVDASAVSSDFLATLGVQPMLGRLLSPDEDQPGRNHVVVLSLQLWQERFGANPEIVGRNVNLDGTSYLVAGVMPASLRFPDFAQMWTPMAWTDKERAVRGEHHDMVIARLRPGVELQPAQAEMNTIFDRLQQLYPEDDKGWGALVVPFHADLVADVRPALLVLLGAVAFVLLITCVNVANLALAKTFSRQKEIAIRTALGATSARVLRQMLTESVLLALAGGALGLASAHFGVRLIAAFLADKLPRSIDIGLDGQVLVFTAVVSVVTGIAAGVLPALRLSRGDVNQALKQGWRRTDADSSGQRTRSILVVSELALSLMLLIGAGLMIGSFQRLQAVNPGFDSPGVLTMTAMVSHAKFPSPAQQTSFFERVLQRVRVLPGVEAAGVIDGMPLSDEGSHQPVAIEGRPALPMSEQPEIDPTIPLRDVLAMDDLVTNSLSQQRFNMLLLGAFAGLALLLAAVGIYSVLSYSVKRRVREIGIRLALGARLGDVLRRVGFEGMKPALLGVAMGTAGALALGSVLSSLLYGVRPTDPVTFLVVAALLAAVALVTSTVPANRATKVDPMVALRYEQEPK
jgi:predicted permease